MKLDKKNMRIKCVLLKLFFPLYNFNTLCFLVWILRQMILGERKNLSFTYETETKMSLTEHRA